SDYLELLDLFVQTSVSDLAAIAKAVASGDAPGAVAASHSIKGAAANLGLTDISAEARTIEERSREGRLGDVGDAVRALEERVAAVARSIKR
ncbi:MAG TPA: Hpt domain-containing protein, partial [Candidatus Bathyarchaeia archaeon]|nr:Hpt domain-containing protein [Candidatus Bathyarchaeia archaeon]